MPLINFTKEELQYIEVALNMLSTEKKRRVLYSEESIKRLSRLLMLQLTTMTQRY